MYTAVSAGEYQALRSHMKILLVEDNPIHQHLVAHSLRQVEGLDYDLTLCESLADALEQLAVSTIDVVLLDLCLPDCEGLETCRRVIAAGRSIPVVVLTATTDRALATEAIRNGAQDYLVKGDYPGSTIARVLQYAIDRHHFQRDAIDRERHFKQVLSHVPAIIWTTDSDLEITSVAGAGMDVLDVDPRQIIGLTLQDYVQRTGGAEGVVTEHQTALRGESAAIETEWHGKIFEARVDPLYDAAQSLTGTIGVALDVTDRRAFHREINFARLVQEALLPTKHPHVEGFEIFGGSHPAKQTCGDWFDYLVFPDGSLGLTVGDVSGKGFGPAILSATIAAYLEVLAESHADIQEILSCCNQLVCKRDFGGQFAVLSLARLQAGARSVIYGGAGEQMLIVSRAGELKHRVPSTGPPLGLTTAIEFVAASQVSLEPCDILLLLSDGFREARTGDGDLFGELHIVEVVAANSQASAAGIFDALWQAVRKFSDGRSQQDDMTGIVVKVLDA